MRNSCWDVPLPTTRAGSWTGAVGLESEVSTGWDAADGGVPASAKAKADLSLLSPLAAVLSL